MKSRDEQDLLPFAGAPSKEAEERAATWTWRARIAAMLDLLAVESRPCKACGAKIWVVKMTSGKFGVWNDDARSHFATCPQTPRASPAESAPAAVSVKADEMRKGKEGKGT